MRFIYLLFLIWAISAAFDFKENKSLENDEYEVKAAFIYNFTKYIEWENEGLKDSPVFKIAVFKNTKIEGYLRESLKNKKVGIKKIEIKHFDKIDKIELSHIIFIPEEISSKEFKSCVALNSCKNALIVSETSERLVYGSCINFLLINNKIKFEISLANLKKNKLKASSQLLKLAERIVE